MAIKYHSENGNTLTSSQEELLEMIEILNRLSGFAPAGTRLPMMKASRPSTAS